MSREEAARLNITDSLQVRPNNDFGGMLAVMHNLHCLVRFVSTSASNFLFRLLFFSLISILPLIKYHMY